MSKKNSKSSTKKRIRKLWILTALLDCDQWSQMDIKKLWYILSVVDLCGLELDVIKGLNETESSKKKAMKKIDEKYKKYEKPEGYYDIPNKQIKEVQEEYRKYVITERLKELNKTKKNFEDIKNKCKSDISIIIKELKDDDIITEKSIIKKSVPKHARSIGGAYTLNENETVLYLILDEINNHLTPTKLKELMLNDLMNSKYLEKVVNEKLVKTIEKELYLALNDNDKKLILFFLERYPTVLYNILKEINTPSKMINEDTSWNSIADRRKLTNGFIMNAKNWAYEDIKRIGYGFNVDYEVKVTIKNDDGKIVIKHSNSHEIFDPEKENYTMENNNSWDAFINLKNNHDNHRIEFVENEIKDKNIFIKDNEEQIHYGYLYSPSQDVAPY
jgi:hypothetical protein